MNSPEQTPAPEASTQAVVSEPTTATQMAAFLFDEPNEVFEDKGGVVEETTPPASNATGAETQLNTLAQQAAQAQSAVEPPTVITPQQAAQIEQLQQPIQQQQQQVASPVQQQQPPPVVQQPPVIPVQQQQQQQQVAQPSPEEIRKQLNVYELTEQDYNAVFETESKEASIKALNDVLQKAVRQAVTMSNVLIQQQIAEVQQQVSPYMQFADEQRMTMLDQAFYSRHADLQAAKPVVDAVLKQFQQSGQKFASAEQLFDAVAQNTKAYLLQLQQLGQTTAPATQGLTPTNAMVPGMGKPPMAVLPSGGQGGAGASGGVSGKTNTAERLFG